MYVPHFGLKREPFSIAPDPRYLFMSERHREALAHLLYGVRAGGGFVLLTGEIGAGKTTVCRCFLEQIPKRCNVAYIFNPRLTVEELLKSVCAEFSVPLPARAPSEGASRPTVTDYLDPLNAFLLATHAVGQNNVLIIDEAQQLSAEVLEQLRLLTNLETSERKLLQVILIGQPELRSVLARPELEQLAQRVIARYHLQAMTEPETLQYVEHRLAVAGLKRAGLFSPEALQRVHQLSRGVPRRINLLCDRAMLGAYANGRTRIGRSIVEQAAAEVFDSAVEARPQTGESATRASRVALVGAGVAIGAALFAVANWALRDPAPAALSVQAVAASASASAPALAGSAASAALPAATTAASAASATSARAAAASAPAASAAQATTTPADEPAAWRNLAAAWKLPADDGDTCEAARRRALLCYRGRIGLPMLRQLNRPGLIVLQDGDAAPRHAVLESLSGDTARVRIGAVVQELPLAALRDQWRGDFATLWRPPPGFVGAQVTGRDSPAGRWVSAKFDTLPGAAAASAAAGSASAVAGDPAAREAEFEARVRAFQRAQGLPPDGVAGPVTLMQLNRVLGVDEPRLPFTPLASAQNATQTVSR